jgi:epoxyqueuosine reductase
LKQQLKALLDTLVIGGDGHAHEDGIPFFEAPLLGVAALDDPLFEDFKQIIGEFHLTPAEVLEKSFPSRSFSSGSVVVWVLPIHQQTRVSNRKQRQWPSRSWTHTRQFGEAFNVKIRKQVTGFLAEQGGVAVAPQLSEHWSEVMSPTAGAASNWSERHAAYAAGLGTFSLNDGLITARGMAHRIGSVVTDQVLEPDPRPYPDHLSNCLYYRNGSCGVCISRCPVGALSFAGHDKIKCMEYVYGTVVRKVGPQHGVQMTGCGLCQTKVPCEACIPK